MSTPAAYVSSSAASRLAKAHAFLGGVAPGTELVIAAPSRASADDLARRAAGRRAATTGWHRFSLLQLAARLASPRLAAEGVTPASTLAEEAMAARAGFEALRDGRLGYFAPVIPTPGFPRALARTLGELRAAGVDAAQVMTAGRSGGDLAVLLEGVQAQLQTAGAADRARLLQVAIEALEAPPPFVRGPLLLLDIAIDSELERAFIGRLLAVASDALVTVPAGDRATLAHLHRLNVAATMEADEEAGVLARLRRHVFAVETPPAGQADGALRFFASPGEGREALDIARFALQEAVRGVPFDEMAVLVRSGRDYLGLLEHAFARAEMPAWFSPGTRRPHPAGRALLALLACADENLSAKRFAEYLSLGQVPAGRGEAEPAAVAPRAADVPSTRQTDDARRSRRSRRRAPQPGLFDEPVLPHDEVLDRGRQTADERAVGDAEPARDEMPDPSAAVLEGSLHAPWRWEELLNESQVIGGADRWRRLDGLARELELRLARLERDEGLPPVRDRTEDPPRVRAIARDLERLASLRAFALPIVEELTSWPARARWGEWLGRFEALVPRAIRQPYLVMRVLADLRPLAGIGAVTLREVRDVLAERLRTLTVDPPAHPYGRVFVGTPEAARGRTFRVVFVPGLAERVFPQRLREDPLLDDDLRGRVSAALTVQDDRVARERLRLQLAVGAATERVYVSYPRVDVREARPRVPSFYALEVIRAVLGRLPGHAELEREAASVTQATLAWPAPPDPAAAIDEVEHDLAVLRPLLRARDASAVKGRAHYLLTLNDHLYRSLTDRWKRWHRAWSDADGLIRAVDACRPALEASRLTARPYSVSALQRYAACPYQFLLGSLYRLAPFEPPEPLQRLDPLTRGALFHRVQAELFRALRDRGLLPVQEAAVPRVQDLLDQVLEAVAESEREALAPAVERVWRDELASIRRDLRRWIELMPERDRDWMPEQFELGFGVRADGRDEASLPQPAVLGERFILRGAVDLIERHVTQPVLRVTDHKTGKCRIGSTLQIGGGAVLQPVLYGLAVERLTGISVLQGRLYYCTSDGQFREHIVELFDVARRHGIEALEIIDRAVERGVMPAAPQPGACRYCDFRPVCGPSEERRMAWKNQRDGLLDDLHALRGMP